MDGIKKYRSLVAEQKAADVGEADTVMLVTEILSDVFGYDKLKEITAEYKIKGNRCDLATKIDEKLQTMIEVKAIGHVLKDQDVEQATNYVANLKKRESNWALLTNGQHWRLYSVECKGKISQNLVIDIDFLALDHKSEDHLGLLFLLGQLDIFSGRLIEFTWPVLLIGLGVWLIVRRLGESQGGSK